VELLSIGNKGRTEVLQRRKRSRRSSTLPSPGGASIALDGLKGVTHETNIDSANQGMSLHG
jgi:hypothetical protein